MCWERAKPGVRPLTEGQGRRLGLVPTLSSVYQSLTLRGLLYISISPVAFSGMPAVGILGMLKRTCICMRTYMVGEIFCVFL